MFKTISIIVAITGLLIIGGSAGDCDGECMEQANTIGEMLTMIAIGMIMLIGGTVTAYNS